MSVALSGKLDGRFVKQLKKQIKKHSVEVGILENKVHKPARPKTAGLKSLAGGPARRTGRGKTGLMMRQVSKSLRKRLGINYLRKPFRMKSNKDIRRFALQFVRSLVSPTGAIREVKRLENLLQAIVRNPITRGDYGGNRPATAKAKGFNRLMIDTGQLFNSIKARVRKK